MLIALISLKTTHAISRVAAKSTRLLSAEVTDGQVPVVSTLLFNSIVILLKSWQNPEQSSQIAYLIKSYVVVDLYQILIKAINSSVALAAQCGLW